MITLPLQGLSLLFILNCYLVSAAIPSSGCALKSPLPQKTICGKAGDTPQYVTEPSFTTQILDGVLDCEDLCLRRTGSSVAGCINFSYDTSAKLCTITNGALKSIKANATSSIVFYERDCFTCPNPCTQQPVGKELLDNISFDVSPKDLGPWYSSGGNGGIQKSGKSSKGSYFCKAGKTPVCSIQQSFHSCPGDSVYGATVYKWSYNYKSEVKKFDSFSSSATYGGGNSHSLKFPNNSPATLKWREYTDIFQVENDVTDTAMVVKLHPGKASKGKAQRTFAVDNIKLVATDYIVGPQPKSENSLPYGGFESGSFEAWKQTPETQKENIKIVKPGVHTEYGVKWFLKGGSRGPSIGLMQDFYTRKTPPTVPGKAYLFSLDYQTNLEKPLFFSTMELYTGASRTNITNIHNVYTNYRPGSIGTVRMPFLGQINQYVLKITVKIASGVPQGNNWYFLFDNLSFKPLEKAS